MSGGPTERNDLSLKNDFTFVLSRRDAPAAAPKPQSPTSSKSNLIRSHNEPAPLPHFFRSPTGALALFLVGLVIVLLLVNSRRPARDRISLVPQKSASNGVDNAPQLPETVGATWFRSTQKRRDQRNQR